jgi:hypothetical protein
MDAVAIAEKQQAADVARKEKSAPSGPSVSPSRLRLETMEQGMATLGLFTEYCVAYRGSDSAVASKRRREYRKFKRERFVYYICKWRDGIGLT